MSKQKPIEKRMQFYLRANLLDVMLYVHVSAILGIMPGMQIKKAVEDFLLKWNITEEDWALDSAIQTYYRHTEKEYKSLKLDNDGKY